MFSSLVLIFILTFRSIFISLSHPISIGLLILLQALLISLFTGALSNNFWFSYILFLVFLGGLLILFSYMTRLVPNQTFKFSTPIYLMLPSALLLTAVICPLIRIFDWTFSSIILFDPSHFTHPGISHFGKLYLANRAGTPIFLATLLLLTLIIVVNLIKLNKGPLRSLLSG